jgi:hypothetical protein
MGLKKYKLGEELFFKGREGCGIFGWVRSIYGILDHRSEVIIFLATIVGVVIVYYH